MKSFIVLAAGCALALAGCGSNADGCEGDCTYVRLRSNVERSGTLRVDALETTNESMLGAAMQACAATLMGNGDETSVPMNVTVTCSTPRVLITLGDLPDLRTLPVGEVMLGDLRADGTVTAAGRDTCGTEDARVPGELRVEVLRAWSADEGDGGTSGMQARVSGASGEIETCAGSVEIELDGTFTIVPRDFETSVGI